jgi:hypothetical protein
MAVTSEKSANVSTTVLVTLASAQFLMTPE